MLTAQIAKSISHVSRDQLYADLYPQESVSHLDHANIEAPGKTRAWEARVMDDKGTGQRSALPVHANDSCKDGSHVVDTTVTGVIQMGPIRSQSSVMQFFAPSIVVWFLVPLLMHFLRLSFCLRHRFVVEVKYTSGSRSEYPNPLLQRSIGFCELSTGYVTMK
jgi:hypothetical protein